MNSDAAQRLNTSNRTRFVRPPDTRIVRQPPPLPLPPTDVNDHCRKNFTENIIKSTQEAEAQLSLTNCSKFVHADLFDTKRYDLLAEFSDFYSRLLTPLPFDDINEGDPLEPSNSYLVWKH